MSLQPEDDDKPSYLQAFLFSRANVTASLAAAAAGVLLSFPLGVGGIVIAGVTYAAGELLGALYIPGLSTFRNSVDRKTMEQRRKAQIDSLLDQLRHRTESEDGSHRMEVYLRMVDRVDSLERMVKSRACSLKRGDIDRLRDACRDYLARWLASETVNERQHQVRLADVQRRLETVEELLASNRTDIDRRQLAKAQEDYSRLIERQSRLASRMMAIDASLLSMPDAIEEVFQHAVSAPMATDASERLQEAVDRLGIEEDLEADIREELDNNGVPGGAGARVSNAPVSNVIPLNRAQAAAAAVPAAQERK